jgi:hypothetical protein
MLKSTRLAPQWRIVEHTWKTGGAACVGCKQKIETPDAGATVLSCGVVESVDPMAHRRCPALRSPSDIERMLAPVPVPMVTLKAPPPRDLFDEPKGIVIGQAYMAEYQPPLLSLAAERLQLALLNPDTHKGMPRSRLSWLVGRLWSLA